MQKQMAWARMHHIGLTLCLWLGVLAFLAVGSWVTMLLVTTTRIRAGLIIVLLGGWLVLGNIIGCALTLWQMLHHPTMIAARVRRLQWLLGVITLVVASIGLPLSYLWADRGDAPGIIFIGLFVASMPFACWLLTSIWRVTLRYGHEDSGQNG